MTTPDSGMLRRLRTTPGRAPQARGPPNFAALTARSGSATSNHARGHAVNPVAAWLETDEGEDWSRTRHRPPRTRNGIAQILRVPTRDTRNFTYTHSAFRGPVDPAYDPAGAPPQ